MQVIINYLVRQSITVQLPDISTPYIRNRIVYSRTVKLYKDSNNELELRFVNQDQKAVSIDGRTIEFYIIDRVNSNDILLTKTAEIQEDGSTARLRGKAQLVITAQDINDLVTGVYRYSVKVIESDNTEKLVYADDNYGVAGTVAILDANSE
jgi:hypothetical protein